MTTLPRFVALLCAYNEVANLGSVLRSLKKISATLPLDATIVVDDGSTDKTSQVAASAGATHIVRLERNCGKATAFYRGFEYVRAQYPAHEFLVSLDADLVPFVAPQLAKLLAPFTNSAVDMTIGSFCGASSTLSGERGLRISKLVGMFSNPMIKAALEGANGMRVGYGLETLLNYCLAGGFMDLHLLGGTLHPSIRMVESGFEASSGPHTEARIRHRLASPREVTSARFFCQRLAKIESREIH